MKKFCAGKRRIFAEILPYCRKIQRISGVKFPQDTDAAFVQRFLIKSGPVRTNRAAFHTSSVKPDDSFLGVIKSARAADLHKRIGDHRNREGHVHMKTPFRPPAGFATFAVYSFKGVKSTVIFYKIRGGNRTERTEKPRRKGKRLEMRPFSFWAKYSGMHACMGKNLPLTTEKRGAILEKYFLERF